MNAPAVSPQVLRLAALLDLERRARNARGPALAYLMVNDTATVVPYQQAALWQNGRLTTLSGVARPEMGGPYARWLSTVLAASAKLDPSADSDPATPRPVDATGLNLPESEWSAWFPACAVWVPLPDPRGWLAGGLLLGRHDPWHPGEIQLLAALAGTYGTLLAVGDLPARRRKLPARQTWLYLALAAAAAAASFIPIRASVLAPAEIVAASPFPVRAPFDGVIDAIHVSPNTPVHKGQLLLSFDTTERRARTDVAAKALEMARAEFTEASQQAMTDPKAKGRLALLQSKVAQAQLDYDYDRTILNRAEVLAPADGVAVFDSEHQWIGRPVPLGERIMIVAPPHSPELDVSVPIGDVVTFDPGAEVIFFPNVSPDTPAHGKLVVAGYGTSMTEDGVMAYTFRCHLDGTGDGLRLGLKGTAKLYGPTRPFMLWVLRRPLAMVREWLSL